MTSVSVVKRPIKLYTYIVTDEIGQVYGAHGSMDTAIDQFYELIDQRVGLGWQRPITEEPQAESEYCLETTRRMLSAQVKNPRDAKNMYFWSGRISITRVRVTTPKPNEERTVIRSPPSFLPKSVATV